MAVYSVLSKYQPCIFDKADKDDYFGGYYFILLWEALKFMWSYLSVLNVIFCAIGSLCNLCVLKLFFNRMPKTWVFNAKLQGLFFHSLKL